MWGNAASALTKAMMGIRLREGVIHDDDDAGRLGGYIADLSPRHADRGGHHGRGVIDAIPHVKRFGGGLGRGLRPVGCWARLTACLRNRCHRDLRQQARRLGPNITETP